MDLTVTLALLVAGVGATIGCGWMGAKPKDYSKSRRVPWQLLMLVGAAFVLVIVVHLLNLAGMTTGQNR